MVMLFFIRGQTLMSSCGTGGLSVFAFFVSTDHFPAVVKHEMPFWHGFKKGNEKNDKYRESNPHASKTAARPRAFH